MSPLEAWMGWVHERIASQMDLVLPIIGGEGTGKSTLAFQLARKLDPTFTAERIQFAWELYFRQTRSLRPGQAGIFDEAINGAFRRNAMSRRNREFIEFLVNDRHLRQIHILCVPSFSVLEGYVDAERAPWAVEVVRRGRADWHEAERPSRITGGGKVWWHRRFYVEDLRPASGPEWESYLARKEEWVRRFDRNEIEAVEAGDRAARRAWLTQRLTAVRAEIQQQRSRGRA